MLAERIWRTLLMTVALGVLLATLVNNIDANRANASAGEEPDWETFTVKARDQSYHVKYWINGGGVVDMVPDVEANSFTITIRSEGDGKLTIMIPRELVDTRIGADGRSGEDTEFAVFVDGESVITEEIEATSMTRTLTIDFDQGSETIEIVGTLAGMSVPSPNEWKTALIVGRFLNSKEPDQIFKIQYRVINGTVENFIAPQEIRATASSDSNGALEIKFPRNYPYTNDISNAVEKDFVILVNDEGIPLTQPEITDCFFVFSIPFSGGGGSEGSSDILFTWGYLANGAPYHGDKIHDSCIGQTIAEREPYGSTANIPTAEQFTECSKFGIDETDCTDIAILQRDQQQISERKTIEATKIQVANAMYMIGIGAAIAGVFAFIALRKRV